MTKIQQKNFFFIVYSVKCTSCVFRFLLRSQLMKNRLWTRVRKKSFLRPYIYFHLHECSSHIFRLTMFVQLFECAHSAKFEHKLLVRTVSERGPLTVSVNAALLETIFCKISTNKLFLIDRKFKFGVLEVVIVDNGRFRINDCRGKTATNKANWSRKGLCVLWQIIPEHKQ